MSVSRDELEDLLNEADKFVNNGGMAVVSQQEEDEINALIGECERVSISNATQLIKTKAVAKNMSLSQTAAHSELVDLHTKELEVLASQKKLSEISAYLNQVEMTNMSLQHEISEIKNTTEWEYFQHIAADQFAKGCHLREIARIENAADREVKLLLVNERNPHLSIGAKQPLFRAVLAGDAELVRQLIADGANVNMPDSNGHYPICDLMAFNIPNCSEILQVLIAAGVNLNQENCFGWTAMSYREAHLVGVRRDPRTLELLKKHNAKRGADPRSVITGWESASTASVVNKPQEVLKDSKALRLNAELLAQELAFEVLYERITQYQARKNSVARVTNVNVQSTLRPVTKLNVPSKSFVEQRGIFGGYFNGLKQAYEFFREEVGSVHIAYETEAISGVKSIFNQANKIGEFFSSDLHKWKSGQNSYLKNTLLERSAASTTSGIIAFTKDNVRRAIDKLENTTVNDYTNFFGDLTTGSLIGYGIGRAVERYGSSYEVQPEINRGLDEGIGNSLLIGAGRSFVETGEGIKQFSMEIGEKIGIVNPDSLQSYNRQIQAESQIYSSTPVANSTSGKVGKFGTDVLVASLIPGGSGLKGAKLVVSGAITGGIIGGLQPVYDGGGLEQRAENAIIGAATGAVVAPVVNKLANVASKPIVKMYERVKGQGGAKAVAAEVAAITGTPIPRVSTAATPVTTAEATTSASEARAFWQGKESVKAAPPKQTYARELPPRQVRLTEPNVIKLDLTSTNNLATKQGASSTVSVEVRNEFSARTQRLIGKHNRFKSQFFEREGAAKSATALEAARIELNGGQIPLAVERGVTMDHITKVRRAQGGLVDHIENLNNCLSHPNLPAIERQSLQQELSESSKLLDYSEQFVPRLSPVNPVKSVPLKGPDL